MVALIRSWSKECLQPWLAGGILALLVVFVAAPVLVPFVLPMSSYYELRSVTVSDTSAGVSPRMIVDREIKRDFRGRFEIEVMKADGAQFVAWWECGSHDSDWRMYRKGASLPASMTLDWWMGVPPNPPCPLPPGTYKVISTIYARGWMGAVISTTADSNIFTVYPPGEPVPTSPVIP